MKLAIVADVRCDAPLLAVAAAEMAAAGADEILLAGGRPASGPGQVVCLGRGLFGI